MMQKITIAALGLLALAASQLAAQTGAEIIQKSRDLNKARTTQMQVAMTLVAKDGSSSSRELEQYGVEENGLQKALIVFKKPASVANTRFLVVENAGRAEDRWIYLPSLDKVRRIASGEGSGSFVGTDFTYDDISAMGRGIDRDNHSIVREEEFGGKACYVIETVPKKAGDGQYTKSLRWIDKTSFAAYKVELYGKDGALIKVLEISRYETVDGYLTPRLTKMTSVKEKTSTTLEVKAVKYDKKIPAAVFTQDFLKTGKL